IPGDGTGPELTEATRRVLEATGVEFDWDVREAGADVMEKYGGNPLPDEVLEAIRETGVALKGPITTPVGGGFRSVNVALRKSLDLYGQVRPCKTYPGVRTRFDDVDLIIVRENTEDLYAGIEYEEGTDDAHELIDWIERHGGRLRHDSGISIKPISITGTRRIFEFASKYKGQNKVNPMAEMLSGMLMLRHLDEVEAAERLESAIAEVIREGRSVTYDMKPARDDPTAVGTSEVADAIIDRLSQPAAAK